MRRRARATIPGFATMLVLAPLPPCGAAEAIRSFHGDIEVRSDGTMAVTETIMATSEGREIRRGIYRDFPTRYTDPFGSRYRVGFEVVGATRDGSPEAYHVEPRSNGYRVYLGRKDVFLRPGGHTWTLSYTTDRQLGFFDDHDELYWNVTGNGWEFTIEEASATVRIPGGFPREGARLAGYTGPEGSRERAYTASVDGTGAARFAATRSLRPREGLTIVAGWPKGIVREPTRGERVRGFLADNRSAFIGIVGLALVFLYYLAAWALVGMDPARGTIIPLYEPPKGFSPAQVRYLRRMGYDHTAFSAAVINLAVKGLIRISEEGGVYTLSAAHMGKGETSPEEARIAAAVIAAGGELALEQENHEVIRAALTGVEGDLKQQCGRSYFVTNLGYFAGGVIISALALLAAGFGTEGAEAGGTVFFMAVWLTGWTFGTAMLIARAAAAWRAARWGIGPAITRWMGAIGSSLIAGLFLAGEIVVVVLLCRKTAPLTELVAAAYGGVNYLFYRLLKAPTMAGRRILDQVEGFRMFLSVAEKDRLNFLAPADRTPELFEKYLPYALALDVGQQWSEQFSDVLAKAAEGGEAYHPAWYAGSAWNMHHAAGFTSGLSGSLAGAVSSSSTAPGSSSGFGGGGGSGGGGGGGGGGGW
ncbi:MAG: DUF2207 domain-containing protein [Chlamydiota bacterium]